MEMGYTYFFPAQSREPTEKGCSAAFRSLAYRSSPIQRSGTKDSGSLKLRSDEYMMYCGAATMVCVAGVSTRNASSMEPERLETTTYTWRNKLPTDRRPVGGRQVR